MTVIWVNEKRQFFSWIRVPMFLKWEAQTKQISTLFSVWIKKIQPIFFSIQFDSQAIDPLSIDVKLK